MAGVDGGGSPYAVARTDVVRLPGGETVRDAVAVEEPLEIRIGGAPVAVTMRTPGHDEELALGFCLTEGIPARSAHATEDLRANTVDVDADKFDAARVQRNFYTSSSCGVCGKGALEAGAGGGGRGARARPPARRGAGGAPPGGR